MKGYMTVEASLVLPLVFGMMMFVLSLLVYSYDRCVLEQEVMSYLVGSQYREEKTEDWYLEKYVWMGVEILEKADGSSGERLGVRGNYNGPFFADVEIERRALRFSPTFWLRQKNKLEKRIQRE